MDKMLLVGATGMVGSALAAGFDGPGLTLLVRRASGHAAPHIAEIVAAADTWPATIAAIKPVVVFNCLGTTIRQAGSQAAFRAVDHDLVLAVAAAAKAAGARQFISISSVGASAGSGNFYLKTKGEVEAALRALNFDRLDIMRPGLLTGPRGGAWRPGESVGMALAPLTDLLMHGAMRRYRSVPGATVARAMLALAKAGGATAGGAKTGGSSVHGHDHDAIVALAD